MSTNSKLLLEFEAALEREQNNILSVLTFQSEDLMEKLKLLNYENQILRDMRIKAPHKFYFIKSINPGEQFFMFISICAWLIRMLGKNFKQPEEFDDPNTVITDIINVLKEVEIPTEFPSNKLIQGAGPICLFVLDCLATQALKISKVTLNHLHIKEEEETLPEYAENDAEVILERVEEEQNELLSDDTDDGEEQYLLQLNWTATQTKRTSELTKNKNLNFQPSDSLNEIENWRLELERVLPQLKIVVKSDLRDWRTHLKQMTTLKANIDECSDETYNQLKKLQSDITYEMEKVESRERHLNNELQTLIVKFKELSTELSNIQATIKEINSEQENITSEFNSVIAENDVVKNLMDQRGQSMSDGSPVINLKKSIAKLKEDIQQINLEVGLLNHSIDQDFAKQSLLYYEIEAVQSGTIF
ncbi:intraflagellar transport protein 57 homolog [Condylostylus longicornis]|uniref:intraflagellar transport protein 57 homolog n=1 Tax=Condylostylus longicornis TaxID=2530218 RepID=UPI00244E07B4|nr:intraflagellar transport protein 57 homolog [Condylostylus longicornis]